MSSRIFSLSALTRSEYLRFFVPSPTRRERFFLAAYKHALSVTVANWTQMIVIFRLAAPAAFRTLAPLSGFMAFYLCFCVFLQYGWLALGTVGLMKELKIVFIRPGKVWNMYCTTLLSFSMLYLLLFAFSRDSFIVPGYAPNQAAAAVDASCQDLACQIADTSDNENLNGVFSVGVFFIYFGTVVQTSTGYGDISPSNTTGRVFVDLQMAVALMYHVGVFGMTLNHFQTFSKSVQRDKIMDESPRNDNTSDLLDNIPDDGDGSVLLGECGDVRLVALNVDEKKEDIETRLNDNLSKSAAIDAALDTRIASAPSSPVRRRLTWPYFRRLLIRWWNFASHHVLLTSLFLQLLAASLMWNLPHPFMPLSQLSGSAYTAKLVVIVFMSLLLLAQFAFIAVISTRLLNRINSNELTISFLAQSYFSTALFYAMLYLLLYSCTPSMEFSVNKTENDEDLVPVVFMFTYFSITSMSGTGFGDVYARGVWGRIAVTSEMIASIIYQIVIIGLGLSLLIERQDIKAEKAFRDRQKKVEDALINADDDAHHAHQFANVDVSVGDGLSALSMEAIEPL